MGETTVRSERQGLSNEPAGVLLDRIRAQRRQRQTVAAAYRRDGSLLLPPNQNSRVFRPGHPKLSTATSA
jgi:hypothetical protein